MHRGELSADNARAVGPDQSQNRTRKESQRIPAPTVRAIAAMRASAQLKRARLTFTFHFPFLEEVTLWIGNRAVSLGRSLALRPRLAAGLPWTTVRVEGWSLDAMVAADGVRAHGPSVRGTTDVGRRCRSAPRRPIREAGTRLRRRRADARRGHLRPPPWSAAPAAWRSRGRSRRRPRSRRPRH